jgi:hypothetical protein
MPVTIILTPDFAILLLSGTVVSRPFRFVVLEPRAGPRQGGFSSAFRLMRKIAAARGKICKKKLEV